MNAAIALSKTEIQQLTGCILARLHTVPNFPREGELYNFADLYNLTLKAAALPFSQIGFKSRSHASAFFKKHILQSDFSGYAFEIKFTEEKGDDSRALYYKISRKEGMPLFPEVELPKTLENTREKDFSLQIPAHQLKAAAEVANKRGISLNEFMAQALQAALEKAE